MSYKGKQLLTNSAR